MKHFTPCLFFENEAEDAARFYTSVFTNSKITQIERYPDNVAEAAGQLKGSVMCVLFELNGQPFMALNGKPKHVAFDESISLMAYCDDQAEIDRVWDALCGPGSGGQEVYCGWLKDKYGVAWQIVPSEWATLLDSCDAAGKARYMGAMMQMVKFDLAKLRAAAKGE